MCLAILLGMAQLISALFLTTDAAEEGIVSLLRHGYSKEEVGVILSDSLKNKSDGPTHVAEKTSKTERSITVGGFLGAAVAGAVTVGAFAALGPFAALLAGMGGGLAGSLAGAIVGEHIPMDRTKAIESRLSDGGILVGVYLHDPAEEGAISDGLRKAGGEFVEHN